MVDDQCVSVLFLYAIVFGMDVLTDLITAMRTGRPVAARVAWQAPWAQRFAPVPGASGFTAVLQGECWLVPDEGLPVRMRVGDVAFLPDGRGHVLADSLETPVMSDACGPGDSADGPGKRPGGSPMTVAVCGAYEVAQRHPLLFGLPDAVHVAGESVNATVQQLAAELEHPGLGSASLVPALLDTLLVYLLRGWISRASGGYGLAAALNDRVTARALHAVHRSPELPWTVAKLAAESGVSRAAFAERFTVLVRRTPVAYLTWWRMATAARLLRETDLSMGAVAAKVGYSSEFAFAAAFKREHGVPPGRFRRGTGDS